MIKPKLKKLPVQAYEKKSDGSTSERHNEYESNSNVEYDDKDESDEGHENSIEDIRDMESNENKNLYVFETESGEEKNKENKIIETIAKTRQEIISENVLKKYEERQGKQLYVRFPKRLPETVDELEKQTKALSSLIISFHQPRQKHARFCLVNFATKADRDAEFSRIKKSVKSNENLEGIVVSLPRTESIEFVHELAERKVKSFENKKAKLRLKKVNKFAEHVKNFTSSVVIINLPTTTSVAEVRDLVPSAIDIQMKVGRGQMNSTNIATITLPSTTEARTVVKKNLTLNGVKLIVQFGSRKYKKRNFSHQSRKKLQQKLKPSKVELTLKQPKNLKEKQFETNELKQKQRFESVNTTRKLPKKLAEQISFEKNQKKRKLEG